MNSTSWKGAEVSNTACWHKYLVLWVLTHCAPINSLTTEDVRAVENAMPGSCSEKSNPFLNDYRPVTLTSCHDSDLKHKQQRAISFERAISSFMDLLQFATCRPQVGLDYAVIFTCTEKSLLKEKKIKLHNLHNENHFNFLSTSNKKLL